MKIKRTSGITLTETMISLAIFTVIIAGIYATLYAGNLSWAVQDVGVDVLGQARRAVGRMTRDLRVAQNLVITQGTNDIDVDFTLAGAGNISYAWTTSAGDTQYQLIRTDADGGVIVARDISALALTETA